MTNAHALYVCYFGLRESLVQTQVLPYLREIAKLDDLKVSLLTFEPNPKENWTADEIEARRKKLAAEKIHWHFLTYHKRPSVPATLFDVLNGVRLIRKLNSREKIDLLHARAHIPMLMAMLAGRFSRMKIIFDIRGLMAEEYSDAGIWKENSLPFRLVKQIESRGIKKASQIVVLTNRMRDHLTENKLKEKDKIEVIPCCVDFSRINGGENRSENEKSERFELVYAGSVTGLYLLREMGRFFLELKKIKSGAFFRILTASPRSVVAETFDGLGIDENEYAVAKVSPGDVPEYLKRAHLGISFRSPTFSQIAASPTKIPEYLSCGIPVVVNSMVGDTAEQIEADQVGVVIDDFTEADFQNALKKIEQLYQSPELAERCRRSARSRFDLEEIGGRRYRALYQRILQR